MKIAIEDYNPKWPAHFQQIVTKLNNILVDFSPKIEHIGSTSVPNLIGKMGMNINDGKMSL
ncbi:GrpB family protein [Tamlana sp. 2201CG12-4]|uniref:GrpB family protein n=1 Tax=Tamlana sp. 2201CG12-4 TaxID=3112582 RepID=UPI002DB97F4E|nr:GrpB family protein [Tamlana sp. 2201CG12-4]MEC3907709.1 GrpB family protein [Tamlana sp. 2201CG12-4]